MTSTNTQAKERPPGIPEWVNLEVIVEATGGETDRQYRLDLEPQGRLIVDELARWTKAMLAATVDPAMEVDREVSKAVDVYLGYDAVNYVLGQLEEITDALETANPKELYEQWSADPKWQALWDMPSSTAWFDLRLDPKQPAAIDYAARFITDAGGTVTWPEGSPR